MPNIRIGCQLPQESNEFEAIAEAAQDCEKLGYDSVWAYDHLSPFWWKHGDALEPWTLLSAIAKLTTKIRIGTLVTNVNLRSPSLLAKMTSSLDNLSDGRLIVGLGCGDRLSRTELKSHGYEFADLNERIGRLRETIQILRAMWTSDESSFNGQYYSLLRAANNPKPRQKPHPPIWVGGKHHRILEVAAEMADGWNYWGLGAEDLSERHNYLEAQLRRFVRRPEAVEKSSLIPIYELFRTERKRSVLVQRLHDELREHLAYGTNYFIASFGAKIETWSLELFAEAAKDL